MNFELDARCGKARTGRIETAHGAFETPAFMPCGTKGAVKTLEPQELRTAAIDLLLSNTYHLALRPGEETVAKMGGLHRFMAWDEPILADSSIDLKSRTSLRLFPPPSNAACLDLPRVTPRFLCFPPFPRHILYAVKDKVHVHDLRATVLQLLGLDHAGRDIRLTDVEGHIIREILA